MKITKLIQPVMLLTGILGICAVPLWVGGVFSKVTESPAVNYCPIKFPAIREETLYLNLARFLLFPVQEISCTAINGNYISRLQSITICLARKPA